LKIFDFASNWQAFSEQRVDSDRVAIAVRSIQSLLGRDSLVGVSFLDVGCGSGLFSIAAHKLGASKVLGIDVNPRCIDVSKANLARLAPRAPVEFQIASALSPESLRQLGTFDLVYAWGSLHHTGSMWNAINNVLSLVAPRGTLVLAIYNRHLTSPVWKLIKWSYNQAPEWLQKLMVAFFAGIIYIAKFFVTWNNPLTKERGMDFWFDVIDWVGGYPYEYASPNELKQFMNRKGFRLCSLKAAQVPTGCNEFVFRNASA
jgi:2-polyprenyl-6-hydroxyphenyl methylase/3-demethylubiquinone-9 3-methyltransferase